MTYVAEACLRIEEAQKVIDLAFESIGAHCISRSRNGIDYVIGFDVATATVRPDNGVLWLRVQATDLPACHGIKMLLESEIGGYTKAMPREVLWLAASSEPFAATIKHEQAGGKTAC